MLRLNSKVISASCVQFDQFSQQAFVKEALVSSSRLAFSDEDKIEEKRWPVSFEGTIRNQMSF